MQGRIRPILQNRLAAVGMFAVFAAAALGVALMALGGGDDSTQALGEPTELATATASPTQTAQSGGTSKASPTPIKHAGILDGYPMTDDEWAKRKGLLPLAVMVDNTTGAVPQAGLDKADLVYEALVEGGLTRLMAVYWRQDAEKILPVRSARTPFVIWASELGALYAHAGGAQTGNEANAIGQLFQWQVRALNAFAPVAGTAFHRDSERRAPYDLATSSSALRTAAGQLALESASSLESWKFREPGASTPAGDAAGGIEIDFQGRRLYAWQLIQWKWDELAKRYLRYQFSGPHVDAGTGAQLAFATVIVMQTNATVVDDSGHVLLEQFGSGPATVFTGGRAYAATWRKTERQSRTRFYGEGGEEIAFERGPIFIEAIAPQSTFSFVVAPADLPQIPVYVPQPPAMLPDETREEPAPTATTGVSPTSTATSLPPTGTVTRSMTPSPEETAPSGASELPVATAPPPTTLTPNPATTPARQGTAESTPTPS